MSSETVLKLQAIVLCGGSADGGIQVREEPIRNLVPPIVRPDHVHRRGIGPPRRLCRRMFQRKGRGTHQTGGLAGDGFRGGLLSLAHQVGAAGRLVEVGLERLGELRETLEGLARGIELTTSIGYH